MGSSVYKVQCKTFRIARDYCNDNRAATPFNAAYKPPFCLRILPAYRTQEMQEFRDSIAHIVREGRK